VRIHCKEKKVAARKEAGGLHENFQHKEVSNGHRRLSTSNVAQVPRKRLLEMVEGISSQKKKKISGQKERLQFRSLTIRRRREARNLPAIENHWWKRPLLGSVLGMMVKSKEWKLKG